MTYLGFMSTEGHVFNNHIFDQGNIFNHLYDLSCLAQFISSVSLAPYAPPRPPIINPLLSFLVPFD